MRAACLMLIVLSACAAPRTDLPGLVLRLSDPADAEAERLLVESPADVERLVEPVLRRAEPDAKLRLRRMLHERENRRLGPVEFAADGEPMVCDADGENRRPRPTREPEPPPAIPGVEILGGEFSWSPDRQWVAVAARVDGDEEIVAWRPDGSEHRRLTHERGTDRQPAWSPDGKYVAIVTERDSDPEIYIVNVETLFVRRLTNAPGRDHSPRWSHDGSTVFFVSEREGGRSQIYRVSRYGTNLLKVSDGTTDDRF